MNPIIEKLKNIRKQAYLKMTYQHKYAFVGIGNHSIHNLYPVIDYLKVPLKYIVVKTQKNAQSIGDSFNGIEGTTDLNKVLNDPSIKGIFICASPQAHFELVKKSLQHNKYVFVEKPPCTTKDELLELIALEKKSTGICTVGLQKRYAPTTALLKKHLTHVITYNYRFVTGAYPEGDSILDIFIHPLDLITNLFGTFTIKSILPTYNKGTYLIHLKHADIVGTIELSTDYTWKNPAETLVVNTHKGIYRMKNSETLYFEKKTGNLLSIPIEKIINRHQSIEILFDRNSFNPIRDNNQLYTSGYVDEIQQFIQLCENRNGKNKSALSDLLLTYDLITHLKNGG
ncbi:MAG: Gfo/Idh/MocA family oxidoreductase [Phycisphaerales bacterium]|nr:Gfo/Idh/MocA family oxidoreductase [Phycisphaerales bacterium]